MPRELRFDPYVFDVLMRDLIKHDHSPSAFFVYVWLWRQTKGHGRSHFGASLQDISRATGLSKSSVQNAIRRLKRRHLVGVEQAGPTIAPIYRVNEPWKR